MAVIGFADLTPTQVDHLIRVYMRQISAKDKATFVTKLRRTVKQIDQGLL